MKKKRLKIITTCFDYISNRTIRQRILTIYNALTTKLSFLLPTQIADVILQFIMFSLRIPSQ